ncbi:MAG: hypothetical protein R3F18_09870 [Lysobacterales bacterium]
MVVPLRTSPAPFSLAMTSIMVAHGVGVFVADRVPGVEGKTSVSCCAITQQRGMATLLHFCKTICS